MTRKKKSVQIQYRHNHHRPNYIVDKPGLVESTNTEPTGTEG
jgi:hypothetical protein